MALMLVWNNHAYWRPNSPNEPGHAALSIASDLAAEGYAPNHINELPGLRTGPMLTVGMLGVRRRIRTTASGRAETPA